MGSRRAQIRFTDEEADAFLLEERTVTCATVGREGSPHLMPLWYVLRPTGPEGRNEIWAWTFARSQKVKNIERDPRVTLQVEAGEVYEQLRGIMIECEAVLHREPDDVLALGIEIVTRYTPDASELPDGAVEMLRAQAAKRVALQFTEVRRASWDHRKLGGVY
ncbi:MAG: pyridoxamine 5'-phosphate oxidase, partial [Actinobacteria bacterium]|nr:pyridoxamine 5'-phosphate oxidase [Actinomycetota bacterium]